jgi:gas vesicle protein
MVDNKQRSDDISGGALFVGFVMGLVVGSLFALFNAPESGDETRRKLTENVRNTLESITPTDPIAEGIAEGKAAAQRRRIELGLER